MLICGLLDKLDGLVARIFDCRSPFGELFDAITDALCYGFGLIVVAAFGWAPVLPVVLIVVMGFINSGMRGQYVKRAGRTMNYKSYAMERLVGYTGYQDGLATGAIAVQLSLRANQALVEPVPTYAPQLLVFRPIPRAMPDAVTS